jgi:hypothetical protein
MKEYEMFGRFGKGSHRASPTPVAIADFKNGTYSINGVTKTLGEVFTASADWAPWDEAAVVPGVGFKRVQGDAKMGPVSTAALFAAVTQNFTAVIDYRLSCDPADINSWSLIDLESVAVPSYSDGVGMTLRANKFNGAPPPGNSEIEVYDYISTVYAESGEPPIGQLSRTAFTFNGGGLYQATNSGGVVGGTTGYLNPGATLIGFAGEIGTVNAEIIVSRIAFYAPQNNAWLPILSS